MTNVWINELRLDFDTKTIYQVLVDGRKYDEFSTTGSKNRLRRDDMRDVSAGYAEALDGYQRAW